MIGLHRVDANDSGLIAALRTEGLPDPGAGRYFRADDDSARAGYVGLEGQGGTCCCAPWSYPPTGRRKASEAAS
jgi:hypothetical protein